MIYIELWAAVGSMLFMVISSLRSLDMINVMTYDMHGSWDPFTGECSPLYRDSFDSGSYIYFNVVCL